MFHVPNKYRKRNGIMASSDSIGNNGMFEIEHPNNISYILYCQVSDGSVNEGEQEWEHVSVSVAVKGKNQTRTPTWQEMCYIKSLFWDKDDCVIQYHPSEKEYVNMHPFVLHLWRPVGISFPIPDKLMVGI